MRPGGGEMRHGRTRSQRLPQFGQGDTAANHEVTALDEISIRMARLRDCPHEVAPQSLLALRLVLSPFIPIAKHVAKLDDMRMQPVGEPLEIRVASRIMTKLTRRGHQEVRLALDPIDGRLVSKILVRQVPDHIRGMERRPSFNVLRAVLNPSIAETNISARSCAKIG